MLETLQGNLMLQIDMEPRELCRHLVRTAQGNTDDLPTMSATDLSKVPALGQAVEGLASAILATETPMTTLKQIVSRTQGFTDYKDLYDFADRIHKSRDISDQALKDAARQVTRKVGDAVIYEQHSSTFRNAHGLTVELSPTYGLVEDRSQRYGELKFAQDTRWADAVRRISNA
jgi:hypothetical protein